MSFQPSTWTQRTSRLTNFVSQIGRLSLLGTTFILTLIGAAAAEGRASFESLVVILVAALFFHLSVYAWNDIADLRIDRSQPRRMRSPLVRGEVAPRTVATFATATGLVALGLAATQGEMALLWMALALLGLLLYDAFGKRAPAPIATDFVQGLGWAALVVYGAAATSHSSSDALPWIGAYVVLAILLVNGVHGALRDLPNDYRCGARTTAIQFGARPLPSGGATVPTPLVLYGIALQLAMDGLLIRGAAVIGSDEAVWVGVLGGVFLATLLLILGLRWAGAPARAWLVALAHILVALMLPAVLIADRMAWTEVLLLLVLFGVPWAAVAKPLRHRLDPTGAL